jgi:hypothetical protein
MRIRVPAVLSASCPKGGAEVVRLRDERECQTEDYDHEFERKTQLPVEAI